MTSRVVLAAAAMLLAVQSPALAAGWTFYDTATGGVGIWEADGDGVYEIDIGCGVAAHILKLGLFVPDEAVDSVADGAAIAVTVVVDGKSFGPFDAGIEHANDGTAVIAAWADDQPAVADIVDAMLAASGETRVEFLGNAATFEPADLRSVSGKVRDGCGI
jgi:hypothetical protein